MTTYTAPNLPNAKVTSGVVWSIASTQSGPSTTYLLMWHPRSNPSIPVRFVLNTSTPNPYFADFGFGSIEDGFLLVPAGSCQTNCTSITIRSESETPGIADVTYMSFRMTYEVFRVTETLGSSVASFLEVDYSLRAWCFCGTQLPAANVTLPGPQDLSPIATYGLPAGTRISLSVHGISPPVDVFRNNVTTFGFSAGPEGTLSAQLVSEYRWSSVDDYVITYSASRDSAIRYSFDLRFGSLLIDYVPASE